MAPPSEKAKVEGEVLTEPVNTGLLRRVASSELGAWTPQPGGPPLRTVLADILAC